MAITRHWPRTSRHAGHGSLKPEAWHGRRLKKAEEDVRLLAAIRSAATHVRLYGVTNFVDSAWLLLISIGVSLVAGTNVFGLENRARTQRFLTHHGARPGLVWLVKLAIWGVGLAVIWGPLALIGKYRALITRKCHSIDELALRHLDDSALLRRRAALRDGDPARNHGGCDRNGHRIGADDSPALAGGGKHAAGARAACHSGRALGRFMGMERRLAAGSAGLRAMDAPGPAPDGHVQRCS